MPQSLTQKTVNTFVKGLITEASELTFPENASVDELNCSLQLDGTRKRRTAVEFEANAITDGSVIPQGGLFQTVSWENVAGNIHLEFLVVQNGSEISFYEKALVPLSAQKVSNASVSLNTFSANNNISPSEQRIQVTSLNGILVVASPAINTFFIEYDSAAVGNKITATAIAFKERDFEWQGSVTEVQEEYSSDELTSTVSIERKYDTENSGWVGAKGSSALSSYNSSTSSYPALTHAWFSGKNSSGDFSVANWQDLFTGSSLVANGHFVVDVFNKARTFLSTEVETGRFRSVAAFSGRVFYAGIDSAKNGGKIYFSRLTEGVRDLGNCYQIHDPTSEIISDLLDTDGGYVNIPDAHNIVKVQVFGSSLLVFAENGVWAISGVDNVFRATEFSVSRLTDVGLINENTFVVAGGTPIWWGKTGIYAIQAGKSGNSLEATNLSIQTIQTFWKSIPSEKKAQAFVQYDEINQRVYWFYPDKDESTDYKYNNILVLDLNLQAFYPWKITDGTQGHYVIGSSYFKGLGASSSEEQVVNGVDTIVNGSDTVKATLFRDFRQGQVELKLLVRSGVDGKMTVAQFGGNTYLDWGDGAYSSFAEAGYDFMGNLTGFKNAPYVTSYLQVTEEGYVVNGAGYDFIHPSSCKLSVSWDLKKLGSTPREIYKLKDVPVVNPNDLNSINYPTTVVITKSKVRGRGRSMKLRFESTAGKDFHLIGYEVIGAKNSGI
tara:strand:- start:3159 stop:5321 length:2163 start_codon:yes stop_codon:yes gene_type:complete